MIIINEDIYSTLKQHKIAEGMVADIFYSLDGRHLKPASYEIKGKITKGFVFNYKIFDPQIDLNFYFFYDNVFFRIAKIGPMHFKEMNLISIPVHTDDNFKKPENKYKEIEYDSEDMIRAIRRQEKYFSYSDEFKKTLIHEITHYLDSKKYSKTYDKKKTEKNIERYNKNVSFYLNDDSEVNALWHEILSELRGKYFGRREIKKAVGHIKSNEKIYGRFLRLSEKNKRRILKNIQQYLTTIEY